MTAQVVKGPWGEVPVRQPALEPEPKPKPKPPRRKRTGRKPVQLDLFRDHLMGQVVGAVLARAAQRRQRWRAAKRRQRARRGRAAAGDG